MKKEKKGYINTDSLFILHELPCSCNLGCEYCSSASSRQKHFSLKLQRYGMKDFVRFYSKFNPRKTIIWFGSYGETTLYPGLSKVLDKLVECGFAVGLVTNLTNHKFFSEIKEKNMASIAVQWSLHLDEYEKMGITEEIFERAADIRKKGAAVNPLVVLGGMKKPHFEIIKRYAQKHGFKVTIRRRRYFLKGTEKFRRLGNDEKAWLNSMKETLNLGEFDFEINRHRIKGSLCKAGSSFIVIKPDWKIYSCSPGLYETGSFPERPGLLNGAHRCQEQRCDCPIPLYIGLNSRFRKNRMAGVYFSDSDPSNKFLKRIREF